MLRNIIIKILATLLIFTIAFSCLSCGKKTNNNNSSTQSQTSSSGGNEESSGGNEGGQETGFVEDDTICDIDDGILHNKETTPYYVENAKSYSIPSYSTFKESENIKVENEIMTLTCGKYKILLSNDGIKVFEGENKVAYNKFAVTCNFVDAKCKNNYTKSLNYSEYYTTGDGNLLAYCKLVTKYGSELNVYDEYKLSSSGFDVNRIIKVEKVMESGGYSSSFTLNFSKNGTYDYYLPSSVYKDSAMVKAGKSHIEAIPRVALAMTAIRDTDSGKTLSLQLINDSFVKTKDGDLVSGYCISSDILYGSIGFNKAGVKCTYPSMEEGVISSAKYASLNSDNDISFKCVVNIFDSKDYAAGFSKAYVTAMGLANTPDFHANLDKIYNQCLVDLNDVLVYRDTAYVFPFAEYVKNGNVIAYVAQSGYIGMQISLGYELLRYGILTDNEEMYQNGFNVLNMWATTAIPEKSTSGLFYCYNNGRMYGSTAPTMRQLCDGAEGMFDALRLMESNKPTVNVNAWWNFVYGFAEFLVNKQNADGSWYRAYDYDGNLLVKDNKWDITVDDNTLAEEKYSTQMAVRFLLRMYEYTEEERYLNTAIKAGEYVMKYVIDANVYRGGTLDQKGNIDREAGIYALYAMTSLYATTGESKYLEYAEKASSYALAFVQTFDYKVNSSYANGVGMPLEEGNVAGLSGIILGTNISVDVFAGYLYYDCFRMYLWTGSEGYLKLALVLQNCQKRTMDIDGKYGFVKKSFMCEATAVKNFTFDTAEGGVWLPWITNSNIEPMTNMKQTFGSYYIEELLNTYTREQLLNMLDEYGAGGYEYGEIR